MMEWKDYDDFERKYGSDVNPENYALRYSTWSTYNTTGYYLKEGYIKIEDIVGITGGQPGVIWIWDKYESIIYEIRKRYNIPDLFMNWEYFADELLKYYKNNFENYEIPKKYSSYNPHEP